MNVQIYTDVSSNFLLPISFVFWGFVVAYILHIMEESIIPETFVDKMKRRYFSQYDWKKFFCFNTFLLLLNIIAVIIFESKGGSFIIFPLSLASERIFNGFYHFCETIITKKFSSGLLTSVITWILGYLVIRYSLLKGEISVSDILHLS